MTQLDRRFRLSDEAMNPLRLFKFVPAVVQYYGIKMPDPSDISEGQEILLYKVTRGGIVNNAGLARKLAELYIESAYDAAQLARQLPLTVSDEGECWLIQGSAKRRRNELGAAVVRIVKENGRVLNLNVPLHLSDGAD